MYPLMLKMGTEKNEMIIIVIGGCRGRVHRPYYLPLWVQGSVTKNVAPPPSVSLKPALPSIIFASSSAMLSPNPKFDLSVLDLSAQ